jgi:hypothetical protein
MKNAMIQAAIGGLLAAALLLSPFRAAAEGGPPDEATAAIVGGGQLLQGIGIRMGAADGTVAVSSRTAKKPPSGVAVNIWDYFTRCDFSDIGSSSLWKYPSESWSDGAAFIPPKGACRTEEVKDDEGESYEPPRYEVVTYRIAFLRMCDSPFCLTQLDFEKYGFGEHCVWRVHRKTWEKVFGASSSLATSAAGTKSGIARRTGAASGRDTVSVGGGAAAGGQNTRSFQVHLALDDGRILIWSLKDPAARNGYAWNDLAYVTPPMCLKPKAQW